MRTLFVAVVVLGVFLLAPTDAVADRGAEEASALVTVRFDPMSRAVIWPEVEGVMEGAPTPGWDGKPLALFAEPPDRYREISLERRDVDEPGVLAFRVVVKSLDPDVRADRLLAALARNLDAHVTRAAQAERRRQDEQLQRLQAELERLTQEIVRVREEGALPWPLSAAAFFEALLDRRLEVRARLLELRVERVGLEARVAASQAELAAARVRRDKVRTAMLSHWAVIVDTRRALFDDEKERMANGVGSPLDVMRAEETLARAQLERDEMMADVMLLPSGARVAALELALAALRTDLAVLDATEAHLREMEKDLEARIEARRGRLLETTHREEDLRILRDRVLALTEERVAYEMPAVSVLGIR